MKTDHHDPAAARRRLAELRAEQVQLSTRLADLQRRVAAGRTAADVAALAERLIAGEPAAVVVEEDVAVQARAIADQLAVLGKAEDTLEDIVQRDDLRTGQAAALPAFRKAIAHVARLDKALLAVEKIVREAAVDVLAFERLHAAPNSLVDRFLDEPRAYDVERLVPLRFWPSSDYIELYDVNPSRLARWRVEAKSLGDLG